MKNISYNNWLSYEVEAPYALFTDPVTKLGGEKHSYLIPTYEALVGISSSIFWKPTFRWIIDKVRIMNEITTEPKGIKARDYSGTQSKSPYQIFTYTYLVNVRYQVLLHFEWNENREDLKDDRRSGKHFSIAKRMIEKGGSRDIFLGTRECQGFVKPCVFSEGKSFYEDKEELSFGLMFHGFNYPASVQEKGNWESRFWKPKMNKGIVEFLRPEECFIKNLSIT